MDALLQDIRYALRGLRRTPGFALVAILTIGLAIGANTTVFTWLERIALRPLPGVPEAGRLVTLWTRAAAGRTMLASYPEYRDWRDGARAFEGIAAQTMIQLSLRTTSGPAERAWGVLASWNLFETLKVRPLLGRTFLPDEESGAVPVAVLSYAHWQRVFGGDSGVVGRHVLLNGHDFTVIGVLPRGFRGADAGLSHDLWVPVTLHGLLTPSPGALTGRDHRFLHIFARLRPGVTSDQAREDINAVQRALARTYPEDRDRSVAVLGVGDEEASAWMLPVLGALLGVTMLVLLVACANLANLLLARATARRREIGIRLAVGAGRLRLMRQLLTESVVLALGGGLVGLLVALWGRGLLVASVPLAAMPVPIDPDFSFDARVLGFALAVTLATGVAFGLVPALQASKADLVSTLRDGAAAGASGRSRTQSALIAAQVAFSCVALVCAGLFLRGLDRARDLEMGHRDPERLLLAETNTFRAGIPDSAGPAVLERLLERVRAVPGVRSATVATMGLQGFGHWSRSPMVVEGYTFRAAEDSALEYNRVGSDYFETVGMRMATGRGIGGQDGAGAPPSVVVNEAFVRRYWPAQEPLGRRIRFWGTWRTVVGVARDASYLPVNAPPPPLLFVPISQSYQPGYTLHVRTEGDPRGIQQALRAAFQQTSADLPFTDVRTGADQIAAVLFTQRIGAQALAAFGFLALVLSAIGVFGALSYLVSQRTRELGVRMALGATRRDVVRLVLGRALRLTGIGLAVGLVLAVGAGRLLRSQIFGVSPLDPVTFASVVVLLAAVALLAAWLPARRAAQVDPIIALQAE